MTEGEAPLSLLEQAASLEEETMIAASMEPGAKIASSKKRRFCFIAQRFDASVEQSQFWKLIPRIRASHHQTCRYDALGGGSRRLGKSEHFNREGLA